MSAFNIKIKCFCTPFSQDIDDLLYGDGSFTPEFDLWQSWDAFIYECIVKAKELFVKIDDLDTPLIWLLPALQYQEELKQLLITSLTQLFPKHAEHLLFYGAVGANAMIKLIEQKKWEKANVIALDATYKVDKHAEYLYQGIGAGLAVIETGATGWHQVSHEFASSIDFIKHNQLSALFSDIALNSKKKIDLIIAPGNGVDDDSDVWLSNLQQISNLIDDNTRYELPNYKLGKIGALEGLVNLYYLVTSPAILNQVKHALLISQEHAKYQAVASYLWISEEVYN